jgi:hypothetical protein
VQEFIAMKKALVLLIVMLMARWLPAQGTNAASWSPLLLYTNGDGHISPYHCGQMLQCGQRYFMAAVPNRGGQFISWEQVKVAVDVKTVIYPSGPMVITTNRTVTPGKKFGKAWMSFGMEPETVVLRDDHPGSSVITEDKGWQANFTATKK